MLAFMGAVSACIQDDYEIDDIIKTGSSKEGLAVAPTISESQLKVASTRTGSDVDLKEKDLNTLDVFVEHITGSTGDGTFLKQYHLPFAVGEEGVTPGAAVQEAVNNWLADRWRQEGLEVGEKYNIYVAANNPLTKQDVDDVTTLKGLVYNENEDDAIINDDGTFKWVDNQPAGDIYKLYSSSETGRALTNEKEFMMDGVIKEWTPVPGSQTQVFEVTMNRAAAKIVLNLKFDADFLKSLTHTKNGEEWEEKPDTEKVEITGAPAWKFNNFAFGAPVFTPETAPTAGVEVHNSDFNIFHNQVFTGDDKQATITTYSYPNVWTDPTSAPSLVISVGYTQNGDTTYNYYRIPIVPKETTSLDRNTLYVIDATIATRGSEAHEDVDTVEDIYYKVVSWNNEDNEDQQSGKVTSVQHYYLQVNPKVYTLRGDNVQTININFSRAKNTYVDYKLFTFPDIASAVDFSNNTPVNKTAVAPTANNAVWGWYYSDEKKMVTSVSDMAKMGVTITNNNPGAATADNTDGTITVSSTALTNRAIKYILMRVYLKDESGEDKSGDGYYEDVLIRHFPTDNIQSAAGLWSSKTTANWWNAPTNNNWWTSTNVGGQGIGYDGSLFRAKYYYSTGGYIRSANNTNNNNNHNWQNNTLLTNRYKYVIQISSTSDQYVLGRPVLNNNQSKDHVVSPAFMIASQLGATESKHPLRPGNNNDQNSYYQRGIEAANHCGSYKEVDTDGTVWTGWRLPTREEVGVILHYQNAGYDTMDPVMTGSFYWTLEGAAVATGKNESTGAWDPNWNTLYSNPNRDYYPYADDTRYNQGNNRYYLYNTYIRCIRDLSADEIENLNKFEVIKAKYQAKN